MTERRITEDRKTMLSIKSRAAGKALGRITFSANSNWTKKQFVTFVNSLVPRTGLIFVDFKKGIIEGFVQSKIESLVEFKYVASGKDLPVEQIIKAFEEELSKWE